MYVYIVKRKQNKKLLVKKIHLNMYYIVLRFLEEIKMERKTKQIYAQQEYVKELKIIAIKEDKTLQDIVNLAIKEFLDKK